MGSNTAPSARRHPTSPAVVYLALTVVLVVLVASLAFSARQPPPPQIAELTPQAQHQITRAPRQLTSNLGSAAGAQGGEGASTTTTTAPAGPGGASSLPGGGAPIDVPAVHHCFGNPPMQIPFDTQSPPCVAYWAGNNGGATSMGVSATDITVLYPPTPLDDQTEFNDNHRAAQDLASFFNRYFELYGRKITVIDPALATSNDCAEVDAYADGMVAQYQPFATTDPWIGSSVCYRTEMARKGVISSGWLEWVPTPVVNQYAPYIYTYPMSAEGQMANEGAFVCDQLAGKKAIYSPDPIMQSETRRFGLIMVYDETQYPPSPAPLEQALARCGVKLAAKEVYEMDYSTGSGVGASQAQQDILAMKGAGVTTVLCSCDTLYSWDPSGASENWISPAATSEGYFPEWVLSYTNNFNYDVHTAWTDPEQQHSVIGLTFLPAQVPYPETTINQAINMVDPSYQINNFESLYLLEDFYWMLLLIASGIQMAGPDLTPYSFQRGLQLAHFPNPFSPEMEGAAGFGAGSHFMTDDAAVMWWSPSAPGPYPDEGNGAWCYVDGGERFSVAKGNWSVPMNMFNGTCASSPPGS